VRASKLNPRLSGLLAAKPDEAIVEIRAAIANACGNIAIAAELLNINRRTLFRWMKAHPKIRAVPRRKRSS
jgi:transcriptional regulator of acetoin/glycerol metabolism